MRLAEVSEEIVEAAQVRHAAGRDAAQPPLPIHRRFVAGAFQKLRKCEFAGLQAEFRSSVAANGGVPGVAAGHERAARGRAYRGSCVSLRKANSLTCQRVDVRSPDALLAVATQVAVTQIVGEDEQNVRMGL